MVPGLFLSEKRTVQRPFLRSSGTLFTRLAARRTAAVLTDLPGLGAAVAQVVGQTARPFLQTWHCPSAINGDPRRQLSQRTGVLLTGLKSCPEVNWPISVNFRPRSFVSISFPPMVTWPGLHLIQLQVKIYLSSAAFFAVWYDEAVNLLAYPCESAHSRYFS